MYAAVAAHTHTYMFGSEWWWSSQHMLHNWFLVPFLARAFVPIHNSNKWFFSYEYGVKFMPMKTCMISFVPKKRLFFSSILSCFFFSSVFVFPINWTKLRVITSVRSQVFPFVADLFIQAFFIRCFLRNACWMSSAQFHIIEKSGNSSKT